MEPIASSMSYFSRSVAVQDHVLIGTEATVLPNQTLEEDAVVRAGAVVFGVTARR